MKEVVKSINDYCRTLSDLEFLIFSYVDNRLVIVGSTDLMYYHNFEIVFEDVYNISSNFNWKNKNSKEVIEILEGRSMIEVNLKFTIEAGNTIFKFNNDDDLNLLVVAKKVSFCKKLVKYYRV